MHCARTLTLRKACWSSTLKHIVERQYAVNSSVDFLIKPLFRRYSDGPRVKELTKTLTPINFRDGLFSAFLRKIGLHKEKYQLMALGYFIYEDIINGVDYSVFYKDFNMPDTLFSWFLVTELHVWMLMVRYMAEGENGKLVRNNLVEAMWRDVENRSNNLGMIHPKIKRKQLRELSEQFNAAIINYDEGILSEDKVLAGALWRRFFGLECNNPEQLERLLIYVRKQMNVLDTISPEEIFITKTVKWIDLKTIR